MSWLHGKLHTKHKSVATSKPLARTNGLIVEELDGEVLVYDGESSQAHCLSSAAARVWRACDGDTSVEQLSESLELDPAVVVAALAELEECTLLDRGLPGPQEITRREATAKLAKVGAAAAIVPLIYSIGVPAPALAASQKFCLGLITCSGDCDTCFNNFCCCCHGSPSNQKVCTADCTPMSCNLAEIEKKGCGNALGNCNCGRNP